LASALRVVATAKDGPAAAADADDGYTALKFARRVLRHEEEVLGIAPLPAPRREQSSPPA